MLSLAESFIILSGILIIPGLIIVYLLFGTLKRLELILLSPILSIAILSISLISLNLLGVKITSYLIATVFLCLVGILLAALILKDKTIVKDILHTLDRRSVAQLVEKKIVDIKTQIILKVSSDKTFIIRYLLQILPSLLVVVYILAVSQTYPYVTGTDGTLHTIFIREIAERQAILSHNPVYITDITDKGVKYAPITYFQAFHVFMSVLWQIGEESLLKIVPAILTVISACCSYLLIRRLSQGLAGIGAALVLIINIERFLHPVLMEQLLLPVSIAAIYAYIRLLETFGKEKTGWLIAVGIIVGFALSIKQQAFLLAGGLLLHALFVLSYGHIRKRSLIPVAMKILPAFFIAGLLFLPSYADLFYRNGTLVGFDITHLPILSQFSFAESNFPFNPDSIEKLDKIIKYFPKYETPIDTMSALLEYPACFGKCKGLFGGFEPLFLGLMFFIGILGFIGLKSHISFSRAFVKYEMSFTGNRGNIQMLYVLLILFFLHLITAFYWQGQIQQYHQLMLTIFVIFIVSASLLIFRRLRSRNLYNAVIAVALISILAVSIYNSGMNYYTNIHEAYWGGSQFRVSYSVLDEFTEIGNFVRQNIPQDDIIIGNSNGFAYYSGHPLVWITWWGGNHVPDIFNTKDSIEALRWLQYYNATYIFVDTRQTQRNGLTDYIYPKGLIQTMESQSPFFPKVHESSNKTLKLYRVNYCPLLPSPLVIDTYEWRKAFHRNITASSIITDEGIIVSIKGKGDLNQYVRYGKVIPPMYSDGTVLLKADVENEGGVARFDVELRYNNTRTYLAKFGHSPGILTEQIPAGIKFDYITFIVSLEDGVATDGKILLKSMQLKSTSSYKFVENNICK